jgi:predicted Zn-dependent peptidase
MDHPAGEYTTEETLNNVTPDDVKANYAHFAPENAYLVIRYKIQRGKTCC